MDGFMDKLAQKFYAQEMIKANSAADAAELERLRNQVKEYDECLTQMRQLNQRGEKNTDKMEELLNQLKDLQNHPGAEAKKEPGIDVNALRDYIHKEDVKVYRNVQAALQEELEKQTSKLQEGTNAATAEEKKQLTDLLLAQAELRAGEFRTIRGTQIATLVIAVLALLAAGGGLAFQICQYLGIL